MNTKLQRRIIVNGQYVKDLSFESPNAPGSLMQLSERPKIDISFDMHGNPLKEEVYELLIRTTCKASMADDKSLFVVEVAYGGVFTIPGLSKEEAQPVLMIEAATLLFPFVRRLVADVTRDGGFPPLL
ncbi:MAG: protein-export chaperone SecB, partial [Alphaproteobacteria bacterium]|nr:protein-export chaperone SecB [Alphaproteobacteria bacterium]